jgi:hypothetical protein
VAARIKQDVGVDAEITPGARGEFSVWVGDQCVAQKSKTGFPEEAEAVAAVRQALK